MVTGKIFKKFNLKKFAIVSLGATLAIAAIVLPTVFYATESKFAYIDALGNIRTAKADVKVKNSYMGDFDPTATYEVGNVVSIKETKFENPLLRDEIAKVENQLMYEFTETWTGGNFEDALNSKKVKKFVPNNLSTISLPLSQFVTNENSVRNSMGYSTLISGIGRSSITGKFNGSGAAYGPESLPGFATVDNTNFTVNLSGLHDFFTYTKNTNDRGNRPNFDNSGYPQYAIDGNYQYYANVAQNGFPELGDSKEEKYNDRYSYNVVGLYATLLNNDTGDVVDSFYSAVNGSDYTQYADMLITGNGWWGNELYFSPTFSRLSGMDNKTFFLDNDNLGLYLYSKTAVYPMADKKASTTDIMNSTFSGFYQGTGEPLIKTNANDNPKYIGNHRVQTVALNTPKGQINVNVDNDALNGIYIYSRTGETFDPNGCIRGPGGIYYNTDPFNSDRSISYYNGVFSLNKPIDYLNQGEQQEIRWYTPLASTDMKIDIDQTAIENQAATTLATDAMDFGNLSHFMNIQLYNAIPSSFYGGNITVTADNTTGTIWVNVKTGPTVEVSNGSLYKDAQVSGQNLSQPSWLLGMSWYWWDGNNTSAYWRNNQTNPISEIDIGQPLDYTIALTGFPIVEQTKITDTTSKKEAEFQPGISNDPTLAYGPYRLTTNQYSTVTPYEYMKKQDELDPNDQYQDLLQLIFDNLVYNKAPAGIVKPDGSAFIQLSDLIKTSDPVAFNFYDQDHPEWGGRLQFSVSLRSYFDDAGQYVDRSGGFPSVPVVFSGFKAIPGPTTINANYNLNSMITGGAVAFNIQNHGGNGVNYPSDYLADAWVSSGQTVYDKLADMLVTWSNLNPFKGGGNDAANDAFTSNNFMIKNLPETLDDGTKPFTITENDVEYDNFSGTLKITPTFQRYYATDGSLVEGVNTTLGTITISGFQTVDGTTYIPSVVNAILTNLQPSAIVTKINGVDQVDAQGNYIGQELYKIAWNEAINLPTKNYDLPPYDVNDLTQEQLEEIRRVIDIKVLPDDPTWVDNKSGYLRFAVAFKRVFDKNGVPVQILDKDLWPADWQTGGSADDHIFIVTAYGYDNSPGPTGILQQGGSNRNITVNQPNYQPSEFIKNDANAGYPLLRSLISGNLENLPKDFNVQDIVLSVEDFNNTEGVDWDPVADGNELPLVPINKDGKIKVQVYLKKWYDENSKLCDYKTDNQGMPFTKPEWTFEISGFMVTSAQGASDLGVNDTEYIKAGLNTNEIDLSDQTTVDFFTQNYPEIALLKDKLPYEFATPTDIMQLLMIENKSTSKNTQPYLLMKNIPENIKPYNIIVTKDNIVVDNVAGSIEFSVTLRQWFTYEAGTGAVYHPTLEDSSNGVVDYTTVHKIKIIGLKHIDNATIIKPVGDDVDNNTGTITIKEQSTSADIIRGILKGRDPEKYGDTQAINVTELQPSILDDLGLRTYIYVALVKSNGSPYTLAPGSMVEEKDGAYIVNDQTALEEFITWKNNPYYDLTSGTVEIYPMLNIWFGGDNAQIFNQYQSFGAGDLGKPTITTNDGIKPANIQVVKLSGFIAAEDSLTFNQNGVYNGVATITLDGVNTVTMTAQQFVNSDQFISNVKDILVSAGVVSILGENNNNLDLTDINNLIDFNDPNWYKVNQLNGTIEIITKPLKYFDANKELRQERISLIISGFKPSSSAYKTTYIVLIVTIVCLIIILAIVLARILWVKYNKNRRENAN